MKKKKESSGGHFTAKQQNYKCTYKEFQIQHDFCRGCILHKQEAVGCRQKSVVHSKKWSSKSLDLPLGRQRGKNKALPWHNLPGAPTAQLAGIDRKDGLILLATVTGLSLPSEHPAPHLWKQENQQVQEQTFFSTSPGISGFKRAPACKIVKFKLYECGLGNSTPLLEATPQAFRLLDALFTFFYFQWATHF